MPSSRLKFNGSSVSGIQLNITLEDDIVYL